MKLSAVKKALHLISRCTYVPLLRLKDTAGQKAKKITRVFADFVFGKCRETAVIMLAFNALAVYSSHTAQIKGHEKSKRENKEFLIDQEKKERKIDLFLTIIPPFLLDMFLSKKLDKGILTTKAHRNKIIYELAPSIGAQRSDLYQTAKFSFKEYIWEQTAAVLDLIGKFRNKFPNKREFFDKAAELSLNIKRSMKNEFSAKPLEILSSVFDNRVLEGKLQPDNPTLLNMRNGRAYDEIYGQNNGLRILAAVLYIAAANSILMPYLKNKWSNKEYERSLKESGETTENLLRRQRFEYPLSNVRRKTSLFDTFTNLDIETRKLYRKNSKLYGYNTMPDSKMFNVFKI